MFGNEKKKLSIWFEYIVSISKKYAKAIEQHGKKRKILLQVIKWRVKKRIFRPMKLKH